MIQHFIDPTSGKVVILTLEETKLITQSGNPLKPRETQKEFADLEKAQEALEKKRWDTLKKGYVLNNENADKGEAILQVFIKSEYTGALSFQAVDNGVFVYQTLKHDEQLVGSLLHMDLQGNVLSQNPLPKPLAWDMVYNKAGHALLLDLDHYIYSMDLQTKEFTLLNDQEPSVDSFIACKGDTIVYTDGNELVIKDRQTNTKSSFAINSQEVKGTSVFCAAVSSNGKLLALCEKQGEIIIIDIDSAKAIHTLKADFDMATQMEFAKDNKALLVRQRYDSRSTLYFDLNTLQVVDTPWLVIPKYTKEVDNFAFNEDQSKLVLVQGYWAYVYDFNKQELLYSFKIDHLVSSCELKFINGNLGVLTDYGCFSIYKI